MKKVIKSLLVVSALTFIAPVAHAGNYATDVADKLGHGVANIATGWAEVPKNIMIIGQKDGIVAGATVGVFTGLVQTLGRTAYGVMDTATFLIPTATTVKPGYIWEDINKETSYGK
jgi:putative exosortase-associated protein (TIGR04073 family)